MTDPLDFDALWDFGDPAGTEAKFRAVRHEVEAAGDPARVLELDTQIARTFSLRRKFDEARSILARVEAELTPDAKRPRIRYELEMGRTLRSGGEKDLARAHFETAVLLAQQAAEDALCIDAIHMLALVEDDPEKQISHNMQALRIAEASADLKARNWQGSLWNNTGMSWHDLGRLDDALAAFEKALAALRVTGNVERIRIGRWMIAWTWRLQGRLAEALAEQQNLEREGGGGYTFEELAELHLARGDAAQARGYFGRAAASLADELAGTDRLARMQRLAAG